MRIAQQQRVFSRCEKKIALLLWSWSWIVLGSFILCYLTFFQSPLSFLDQGTLEYTKDAKAVSEKLFPMNLLRIFGRGNPQSGWVPSTGTKTFVFAQ